MRLGAKKGKSKLAANRNLVFHELRLTAKKMRLGAKKTRLSARKMRLSAKSGLRNRRRYGIFDR